MSSPTDDEPVFDSVHELFAAEEIALFDARAQVAWHERVLAELAKELDLTTSQLSIAYLLTHPEVSSVITGATHLSQLEPRRHYPYQFP